MYLEGPCEWKLWKYKWFENSLVRGKHSVFQNQCQPQSLPWSVHLTICQRSGHRFYEQLTIFIPRKTYEGDNVQGPGLRPECPGLNSVPLLTMYIVFGQLLHLSVSAVPLWVGGSPADTYPMRLLWGMNEFM